MSTNAHHVPTCPNVFVGSVVVSTFKTRVLHFLCIFYFSEPERELAVHRLQWPTRDNTCILTLIFHHSTNKT